jgi:hypothetical protein
MVGVPSLWSDFCPVPATLATQHFHKIGHLGEEENPAATRLGG